VGLVSQDFPNKVELRTRLRGVSVTIFRVCSINSRKTRDFLPRFGHFFNDWGFFVLVRLVSQNSPNKAELRTRLCGVSINIFRVCSIKSSAIRGFLPRLSQKGMLIDGLKQVHLAGGLNDL